MNMFDEARAIKGTMELCHLTQKEMAKQLGVSQSYVANKLRLLNFSEALQEKIAKSGITERHARTILRISSEDVREQIVSAVSERSLTVRECEALVSLEVEAHAPEIIGCAAEHERIDTFRKTLGSCLDTLRSFGVCVTERQSYYGKKLYITLCIDNA